MMVRITAPHFCAGLVLNGGPCAPIIKYMNGWSLERIQKYCQQKGWSVQTFSDPPPWH